MAIIPSITPGYTYVPPNSGSSQPLFTFPSSQTQQPQQPTSTGFNPTQLIPKNALPGISNGINSLGSSLGFGQAVPKGFIGPIQPGALGSTTSLTGVLGPAAIGGVLGGPIASLTGGNPTGGSIGGALGGAVGSYAAGTAGGLAAGAALGLGAQALNFVLPGLGIIAGGVLGGLFGNKKPGVQASEFAGTISNDGLSNTSIGTKRADDKAANTVQGATADYYKSLKNATGIDLTGNQIRGGSNVRGGVGGGFLQVDSRGMGYNPDAELGGKPVSFQFDINDPKSMNAAIGNSAISLAQSNKLTDEQIKKINDFNAQYAPASSASGTAGTPQFSATAPLITNRKGSDSQSFAEFVRLYKNQQNAGKAPE